jgi:hypothetical protein
MVLVPFVALFTITVHRGEALRCGLLALLPVPCLTINAGIQAVILIAKHAFSVWQGILLVTPLGLAGGHWVSLLALCKLPSLLLQRCSDISSVFSLQNDSCAATALPCMQC